MRVQSINPAKLANLFRQEFELCRVQYGETIALLSDQGTRREYIAASFAAADSFGAHIYEMCVNNVPNWTKVGIPTVGAAKGTVDALKASDLLVCFHVPLFTTWLKEVRATGTRALMVIDHPDDLEQAMAPPGLKEAVVHAANRLRAAKQMRIVSDAGTDLTISVGAYPIMHQYGYADEPGRFDHWGAGHVHTFPNEGGANGRVVISPGDMVVLPYNRFVVDRIELEIRDGLIQSIKGGLDAKLMQHWLDDNRRHPEDRDGYFVSHVGWGLNPQARWDALALNGDDPDRTQASARGFAGNFLFSTGPNSEGGGKRDTKAHYDVPMRDCTVMLDNDCIIERGVFRDPKMVVPRQQR